MLRAELVHSTVRNGTQVWPDSEGSLSEVMGPCKQTLRWVFVCKMFFKECSHKQPVSVKEVGLGRREFILCCSCNRGLSRLHGDLWSSMNDPEWPFYLLLIEAESQALAPPHQSVIDCGLHNPFLLNHQKKYSFPIAFMSCPTAKRKRRGGEGRGRRE